MLTPLLFTGAESDSDWPFGVDNETHSDLIISPHWVEIRQTELETQTRGSHRSAVINVKSSMFCRFKSMDDRSLFWPKL